MRRLRLAACGVLIVAASAVPARAQTPSSTAIYELAGPPVPRGRLDELVFARLNALGLQPSPLCSDAVFLRRAYFDTIGTLPTADEARAFIDDPSVRKREALVDRLIARPEFADYWAMKWSDLLRVKSEFPINLWPNAVQAYYQWIRASVRDNLRYDQFVRTLLTSSGSNFRVGPVNFYRAVQARDGRTIASAVALTFMGQRADTWPAAKLDDMAAFFSQIGYKSTGEWKEEIVYADAWKAGAGSTPASERTLTLPDGSRAAVAPGQDPRVAFAVWLTAPTNQMFSRAIANRLWFWLLGRGIVHEPDDMRADNPPSQPEVLAYLAQQVVASKFDLKSVMRQILTSSTYQLSAIPRQPTADADACFAHAVIRPLEAEVLVDALDQITGGAEQYSSPIPEPYTFVPENVRSIALADGSITSTFLETFGRPPRDTGRATERSVSPTAAQRLLLLNGADVQRKLQQSRALQALAQQRQEPAQMIATLYLTILSRRPSEAESAVALAYATGAGNNRRAAVQDLAWALINSAEFRFRH
jgi:hypothetical protein